MKKENAECHAETRSSRRESNPPTSAFSAPPREKKSGWETKILAEVCLIKPPKSEAREKVAASSLVSFLPMEDMGIDVKFVQAIKTKPLSAVVGSYTYFADGDILLAKITPCFENGKLGIAEGLKNGIGFGSSEYFVFRPDPTVSKEWLYYFLSRETFREEGSSRMTGAVGHKRVSKEFIEDYPIPVPPLAEQQRIVGLLDEAFEGLATAKANAEKNLQNARALFESYLQSVFTQRGPGWVETTLSRATDGIFTGPFGSLLHKSDYVVDGIPLVNPAHITEVGIEPDLRKTVSKATALRLKNYIMREGDIVIGRRGEMGRCAFVTGFENGWLCGTGSFFIKPSSRCNTRYLVRFLRSDSCKIRLEKIAGGAVMPNLSNTDLAISLSICRHSTGRRPSSKKSTPSTKKPNASPASTSGSSPRWRR
jgi:type I restriction enzyme S subunit